MYALQWDTAELLQNCLDKVILVKYLFVWKRKLF